MAKQKYYEDFAFYQQLQYYYQKNRGKIRSRYNDLTKKFLAYNDISENSDAFLRKPQFEALEMYVFVKEFMDNPQVYEMFDDWRNRRNRFSDASYYAVEKGGQISLFQEPTEKQMDTLFKGMKQYRENYPNYIYALTMGLGKTYLIATCIFYEFLLARKYPKDKRFCHNALVFAPDKTVLQSLKSIMTFDKTLVVPPEYASVLDANIHFHFLVDTGTTLHTIDDSDYNIIISNTQKIIVKRRNKAPSASQQLFEEISPSSFLAAVDEGFDDDDVFDDTSMMENQRFKKLCRLPQLGVYVDEAHHLFGSNLKKELRAGSNNKTSLRHTINMLADNTSIVACYNYTGTPYVENQPLPEVVYAYGLREAIRNDYLKDADPIGFDNVKDEEFLRFAIKKFWDRYGGKTYEDLNPKLAIYASGVNEAYDEVKPMIEQILAELDIPDSKILVNTGDSKRTKDDDIRMFNDLDVPGSEGNDKQFIILVEKGKEGWDCRSLFGVALYRSPKSKIFVLQSTMRCLRSITNERQTATVFLSKDNYDTLDGELHKNFNMDIKDMKHSDKKKKEYHVRVVPPERKIKIKDVRHVYEIKDKTVKDAIDYGLKDMDFSKYESTMYEKDSLAKDMMEKKINIDSELRRTRYSEYTITAEVARYLHLPCTDISKLLISSVDGMDAIVKAVNRYNEVLYDVIIPKTFNALYEITSHIDTSDKEISLLRKPDNEKGYYEFKAPEELVITVHDSSLTDREKEKSFHADTYCFDSKPEKELFLQALSNEHVEEIYFTGMFTSNQGDLSVRYYDPETCRIRHYYPDFLIKMDDGTYELAEVKGDHMKDDLVVEIKKHSAEEIANVSGMRYKMYWESMIKSGHVFKNRSKE